MINEKEISKTLAQKALRITGGNVAEIERSCWMVVHEYMHGVMPVEYDIRDIDEDLYLSILEIARNESSANF